MEEHGRDMEFGVVVMFLGWVLSPGGGIQCSAFLGVDGFLVFLLWWF